MKAIKPSRNRHSWPRHKVKQIDCRKRDLVIRIADWTKDKDAPYYDVEVYIGGVYDWNESKCCETKQEAIAFSNMQIAKLL
jgi:hypothetical protein